MVLFSYCVVCKLDVWVLWLIVLVQYYWEKVDFCKIEFGIFWVFFLCEEIVCFVGEEFCRQDFCVNEFELWEEVNDFDMDDDGDFVMVYEMVEMQLDYFEEV